MNNIKCDEDYFSLLPGEIIQEIATRSPPSGSVALSMVSRTFRNTISKPKPTIDELFLLSAKKIHQYHQKYYGTIESAGEDLAKFYKSIASESRYDTIQILYKMNSIFHQILKSVTRVSVGVGGSCSLGTTKLNVQNSAIECEARSSWHDGNTNSFYILWKPDQYNLAVNVEKDFDFRAYSILRVSRTICSLNDLDIIKKFSLSASLSSIEKATLDSWEWCPFSNIQPHTMSYAIAEYLTAQFKACVKFYSNVNLSYLKKNFTDIEVLEKGIQFVCDERGLIEKIKEPEDKTKTKVFILKVEPILIGDKTIKVLIWNAENTDKNSDLSIDELFRWCVFSKMTNSFSKHLGIQVKEKK